jgi:hypothetical protein
MNKTIVIIVVLSLVTFVGRFTIPGHGLSYAGSYEAFTHIFMGCLIILAIERKDGVRVAAIASIVILSAFEVMMYLIR